jgi:oxygen-independent coproporphyrinogen-3 oxidase
VTDVIFSGSAYIELCIMIETALLRKYNIPVPRYTSYPTVPYWNNSIDLQEWKDNFHEQFAANNEKDGISLYIHLPFCESLCTYCGCNKKITTNHGVENDYIKALETELQMYLDIVREKPIIRELHLGGGTPTFFSPQNLEMIIGNILNKVEVHPEYEFSFEGHPNNTTPQHLETLYNIGFRRVSFGVQDNNEDIQRVINRIQPFENVKHATESAREIGYKSVNFDLIYGLPLQNETKLESTINAVVSLKPDRVAFYSYAHVPWTSKGQRLFDENDLPGAEEKMNLYLLGRNLFTNAGYSDIGMDHFALPHDDLYLAWQQGTLFRNFMGYTTQRSGMVLGLGVSSISDTGTAYAQNNKKLSEYYRTLERGGLPVTKGYFLDEEDMLFRKYIQNVSCKGATDIYPLNMKAFQSYTYPELRQLAADKLIKWTGKGIEVTSTGRFFIRNICRAFDLHLLKLNFGISKLEFSNSI